MVASQVRSLPGVALVPTPRPSPPGPTGKALSPVCPLIASPLALLQELTSPRLIKSHLPYRFLPSDLHNGDSKVIPCSPSQAGLPPSSSQRTWAERDPGVGRPPCQACVCSISVVLAIWGFLVAELEES